MTEELAAAGAPTDFQLVAWEPEPNPKSFNPTQLMSGGGGKKRSFFHKDELKSVIPFDFFHVYFFGDFANDKNMLKLFFK